MTDLNIALFDKTLEQDITHKINFKTKPVGSLGSLEKVALQIALVQQSLSPELVNPHIVVFAGDHGIAKEGVSAYPQEVTYQMVMNFVNGGAAINVFCRQNGLNLQVVDAGVNYDLSGLDKVIHAKVGYGTRNFLDKPAMTETELKKCFEEGVRVVDALYDEKCNIVGFGEMGIGNTSAASMIMHKLTGLPIEKCCGKGTGLNEEQLGDKISILKEASYRVKQTGLSPEDILMEFGGYEIAMMCAAMLQVARKKMIVLVDGFIASSAFLCAYKIDPAVKEYALFCHQSEEYGHRHLLEILEVKPLLNFNLRLGEGTGCALAYPIVQNAVAFLNDMASFESAGVSNKRPE